MRALTCLPLSALVLTAVCALACDQDYAASNSGRETFMGTAQAAPAPSVSEKAPPASAPPVLVNAPPQPPSFIAPAVVADGGAPGRAGSGDAAVARPTLR